MKSSNIFIFVAVLIFLENVAEGRVLFVPKTERPATELDDVKMVLLRPLITQTKNRQRRQSLGQENVLSSANGYGFGNDSTSQTGTTANTGTNPPIDQNTLTEIFGNQGTNPPARVQQNRPNPRPAVNRPSAFDNQQNGGQTSPNMWNNRPQLQIPSNSWLGNTQPLNPANPWLDNAQSVIPANPWLSGSSDSVSSNPANTWMGGSSNAVPNNPFIKIPQTLTPTRPSVFNRPQWNERPGLSSDFQFPQPWRSSYEQQYHHGHHYEGYKK